MYLFSVELTRGFKRWFLPSLGNDNVWSHEELVIVWQRPSGTRSFGDDWSADLHSTAEKELPDIWSGQPWQVVKGLELPPQMKAHKFTTQRVCHTCFDSVVILQSNKSGIWRKQHQVCKLHSSSSSICCFRALFKATDYGHPVRAFFNSVIWSPWREAIGKLIAIICSAHTMPLYNARI